MSQYQPPDCQLNLILALAEMAKIRTWFAINLTAPAGLVAASFGECRRCRQTHLATQQMIRRGVQTLRHTRPPGSVLYLAERPFLIETNSSPTQDGDGLCTLARSAGELSKQDNQRIPARQGTPNAETVVVVTVVRLVVVTVGGANVRRINQVNLSPS